MRYKRKRLSVRKKSKEEECMKKKSSKTKGKSKVSMKDLTLKSVKSAGVKGGATSPGHKDEIEVFSRR